MTELINSLRGLLGLEGSDSPSDPPNVKDDATTIAEPPHGWALERKNGQEGAKDAIEATQDWALDQAMEPANAFQFGHHATPPILRGEGYVVRVDHDRHTVIGSITAGTIMKMSWIKNIRLSGS